MVIDDDQDPSQNLNCKDQTKIPKYLARNKTTRLGKRIVYFNKIENVKCSSDNFDPSQLKLVLNSQAQIRMTESPFKAKYFSLGNLEDHSFEEIIRNNLTPESTGY